MTMTMLAPWIVAAAGAAAAAYLWTRLRELRTSRDERQQEVERLGAELAFARETLEKRARDERRRGAELAALRQKLEKTKKRAGRERESRHHEPEKIAALEDALSLAREDVAAGHEQRLDLEAQLGRLHAKLEAARRAPEPTPLPDPVPLAAAEARAGRAEAEAGRLGKELAEARRDNERSKAKLDTARQLYAAIHGELEAKKDRLATQRAELERLRALKVAVIDPSPPAPAGDDARP